MEKKELQTVQCFVDTVLYSKDLFAIVRCRAANGTDIPEEAVTDFDFTTGVKFFVALGEGMNTTRGQRIILTGEWETNPKFGRLQLRIACCEDYVGTDREEIVKYLSSKMLKGIGRKTAESIYEAFGENTLEIIEDEPKRLLEIPGIKEKKLEKLLASYEASREYHVLMKLLAKYHVSYRAVVRIKQKLGDGAATQVKDNPYVLSKVPGMGFKTADDLALNMGYPFNGKERICAAILYSLECAQEDERHMYLTRVELVERCCSKEILNANDTQKVYQSEVDICIEEMLKSGGLVSPVFPDEKGNILPTEMRIFTQLAYTHESIAAAAIAVKLTEKPEKRDWRPIIEKVENSLGVTLDEKQREGAIMALSNSFSVITGGPGCGKTTSLRTIVSAYQTVHPDGEIYLAAPTGRAARRMAEQTGMCASTIHSMLGLKPQTWTDFDVEPCDDEMLSCNLLIIDEASMIEAALMAELMFRVRSGTQVVFLGDSDQLPSVGPGNVLRQLLMCKDVPHTRLTRVFRQDANSVIPVNAQQVNRGINDLRYNPYFKKIICKDEEEAVRKIIELEKKCIDKGMQDQTQILCPMKKRGAACTTNLNAVLQDIINPPSPEKAEAVIAGIKFRVGDKVMQTKNIEGASNGDIGHVLSISGGNDGEDEFQMLVKFDFSDTPLEYDYEAALDLEPATAITIHKSQGGEFPAVIVPLFKSMGFFLRRNLFYTAITRAKLQVVLVTDEKGIAIAVREEDTSKRNTILAKLISTTYATNLRAQIIRPV